MVYRIAARPARSRGGWWRVGPLLVLIAVSGCFQLSLPAQAASISLSARQDCNGYRNSGGFWMYFCYFSGEVYASSPPYYVTCFVEGNSAGSQFGNYINEPDGGYGYASCSARIPEQSGTGGANGYQTEDVAYDRGGGVIASGYLGWWP